MSEKREAAAPAPITPRHPAAGAVTARGHAAISVYRLLRQLRTLGPEDRQYITALLAEELPPVACTVPPTVPAPIGSRHHTTQEETRERRTRARHRRRRTHR